MGLSYDQVISASATAGSGTNLSAKRKRYLYGPVIDFLGLGGVSVVLFPIMLLLPQKEYSLTVGAIAVALTHVLNHPHFAFSYQIFYYGFRQKAFGSSYDAVLRARYIFAGIVVPIALLAFLLGCLIYGNARILGYGANLMGFLVGWHYVKQGYGMLMVDAALKRQYFGDTEKKILLVNSYAIWGLSWLTLNELASEKDLWGIQYYMFHIPPLVLAAVTVIVIVTSTLAGSVLIKKWRVNGGSLPAGGVVAYLVSLYLWQLLARWNLLWLLLVPALHSLQYLTVAARYRANRFRGESGTHKTAATGRVILHGYQWQFIGFVAVGVALGYLGFWLAPSFLQVAMPYDRAIFGPTVFLFAFWVFINVHHYFLDNVMWRSQNPDVRKYLFA